MHRQPQTVPDEQTPAQEISSAASANYGISDIHYAIPIIWVPDLALRY